MVCFYFNIAKSNSPCIVPLKDYLLNSSKFSINLQDAFRSVYSIQNLLDNDLDAIKSRIMFVQNHEPSSMQQTVEND